MISLKDLSSQFNSLLQLSTQPIGLKLCQTRKDLSRGLIPSTKLTLCQMIHTIARSGWWLSCPERETGCFVTSVHASFTDENGVNKEEKDREGTVNNECTDEEIVCQDAQLCSANFEGILMAPLTAFEPDVVILIVSAIYAKGLVEAHFSSAYNRIEFNFSKDTLECPSAVILSYQIKKSNLVVPCFWAKKFKYFQSNEVLFIVPFEHLYPLLCNIKDIQEDRHYQKTLLPEVLFPNALRECYVMSEAPRDIF